MICIAVCQFAKRDIDFVLQGIDFPLRRIKVVWRRIDFVLRGVNLPLQDIDN